MQSIARTSVALTAFACLLGASGCSTTSAYLSSPAARIVKKPAAHRKEAIVLQAPKVDAVQDQDQQPTLLEQHCKLTHHLEEAQVRVSELKASLSSEKALRLKAETKAGELARQLRFLHEQEKELNRISTEYDTAQQELRRMVNKVRSMNQTMHKEELTNVKLQEQIITLKIEMARLKRRQLLNSPTVKKRLSSTTQPKIGMKEVAKP